MTHVTVGRRVNAHSGEERIYIDLSKPRLNADEARDLIERVEEQLALLDGGEVRSVDAVDTPDVSDDERADIDQHSSEEMGGPEYRVGEEIPDDASESSSENESTTADSDEREQPDTLGLDELTAISGIGERKVHLLVEDGFSDLEDIDAASVGAIAQEGIISQSAASEISRFAADALADRDDELPDGLFELGDDETNVGERERDDEPDAVADESERAEDPDQPFACPVIDCRKRFDNRDDRRTHRDSDHDEAAVMRGYRERARDDLVDGVSVLDVEQAAVESTRPAQVGQQLDVANSDARKWCNMLQLGDVLDIGDEPRAVKAVEGLHEKLGIDEPLPNRPGQGGSA